MPRGRIRESLVERRFPNRFNVCGWQRVHPPTRSKLVWKPALRPSAKDLRMRPSTWTYLDTTTRAGGYARRNAGFIRQPRCGSPGCRINPEFRPECVPLLGPLYGSRCSATATRFPAPPLEERVRERRPLRSTFHRDGLVEDPRWKRVLDGNRKSQRGPPLPSPLLPRRRGGSTRTSGRRLCQAERQIYPAAPVRLAGLPDESGVPVVVSGCAPCERRRWRVLLAGDNDFCDREHREQTSRMR